MTVRIYLPATTSALRSLVAEGRLPGPLRAHAVTEALRAAWPDGDDEGWEYAALMAAAADSVGLRGPGDTPRRMVLAADVATVTAADGDDATLVVAAGDLLWKHLASAHVDTVDDAADDDDLAWYATQEIPDLV